MASSKRFIQKVWREGPFSNKFHEVYLTSVIETSTSLNNVISRFEAQSLYFVPVPSLAAQQSDVVWWGYELWQCDAGFSIDLPGSLCKLISSADMREREKKRKKKTLTCDFAHYTKLSKHTQTSSRTGVASHLVFQPRRLWLAISWRKYLLLIKIKSNL